MTSGFRLDAVFDPCAKYNIHGLCVKYLLSSGLYVQARAAILDLGAQGVEPASISALLDDALERELHRLAKKHRDGEPWPLHKGRLPGGRRPRT